MSQTGRQRLLESLKTAVGPRGPVSPHALAGGRCRASWRRRSRPTFLPGSVSALPSGAHWVASIRQLLDRTFAFVTADEIEKLFSVRHPRGQSSRFGHSATPTAGKNLLAYGPVSRLHHAQHGFAADVAQREKDLVCCLINGDDMGIIANLCLSDLTR